MTEDRQGNMKPEVRHGIGKAFHTHSPIIETQGGRAPGNHSAHGNGQQAGGNSAVTHAAEPAQKNDSETRDTNGRRKKHLEGRTHGNEGYGNTSECAEQGSARSDFSN